MIGVGGGSKSPIMRSYHFLDAKGRNIADMNTLPMTRGGGSVLTCDFRTLSPTSTPPFYFPPEKPSHIRNFSWFSSPQLVIKELFILYIICISFGSMPSPSGNLSWYPSPQLKRLVIRNYLLHPLKRLFMNLKKKIWTIPLTYC